MKIEHKKTIVFAVIISLLTSTYAAFLKIILVQSFFTRHFLGNWLRQIPQIYLFILPFVLLVGPLVKALVNRMFSNKRISENS